MDILCLSERNRRRTVRASLALFLADRIKRPLLIYAGADDIRTPLEQTSAMVSALERAGNPPKKVIIKAGEGHGYGKLENNVELYNEILEFLNATIGPKSKR